MFVNLPKQDNEEQGPFKSLKNKKLFFDALTNRFTRKEAVEVGTNFNMEVRTVGSFLKSCLGKYLEQPEYRVYEKSSTKTLILNTLFLLFNFSFFFNILAN